MAKKAKVIPLFPEEPRTKKELIDTAVEVCEEMGIAEVKEMPPPPPPKVSRRSLRSAIHRSRDRLDRARERDNGAEIVHEKKALELYKDIWRLLFPGTKVP